MSHYDTKYGYYSIVLFMSKTMNNSRNSYCKNAVFIYVKQNFTKWKPTTKEEKEGVCYC